VIDRGEVDKTGYRYTCYAQIGKTGYRYTQEVDFCRYQSPTQFPVRSRTGLMPGLGFRVEGLGFRV
jgi:hypothetical protein